MITQADANNKIYEVMRALAVNSSALNYNEFLRISVKNLALLYACKFAFVGELMPCGKRIRTLVVWAGDDYAANFEYDLEHTPCKDILNQKKHLIPADITKLYPNDLMLAEMGVESYFGAGLFARDQKPMGLVSVMNNQPLQPDDWSEPVLSAYSVRLAVEMESKIVKEELETYRYQLETLVEERTQQLEIAHKKIIHQERLATLGQLIATVSHELRNPLGTIRASVYSISEKLANKNMGVDKALDRIQRNVSRSDNIINELLDFTRIKETTLSLHEIDSWLIKIFGEFEIPQHISLKLDMQSDTQVAFDENLMRRVIVNLFDNACQSITSSGTLSLKTKNQLEHVEISLKDTGSGIDESIKDHIFEPLYSTKGFGVGMGLSIVHKIIEQHHGTININSQQDKGTEVIVHLPLTLLN